MSKARVAICFVVLIIVGLSGCSSGKGSNDAATPSPTTARRPSSNAKIGFVDPHTGSDVSAGTIHIRLELSGASLVSTTSKDLSPDKGHVHLSMDGRLISMTSGLEQDIEAAPGTHLLQAEFVATDHAPFDPRVIATVTIRAS